MSKDFLEVDVSDLKRSKEEEDLISIKLANDDIFQVSFSKLVSQSKYIRNKYKYTEALNSLGAEINKFSRENNINPESIKYFLQLIEEERIRIPKERYKDIYRLSEYFGVSSFVSTLDKLMEANIYNDLDFTLEVLYEETKGSARGREGNGEETVLNSKMESFLIARVNECFVNGKFGKLPISTVCRVIEKSDKERIDNDSLVEFVVNLIDTYFVLLKFIQIDKLSDEKLESFLRFLSEQNEQNKKRYLEYMPFNLIFALEMKNKCDNLFRESNQIRIELNQNKEELKQVSEELNKTKAKLNQKDEELKQSIEELNKTKSEIKKCTQSIMVVGNNRFNQLCEKSTNKNKDGKPIISPPLILKFDPSSLLSYSVYSNHCVIVTRTGLLKGIGKNNDGRISTSLSKMQIDQLTEFTINDDNANQLTPISSVCSLNGILYMLLKSSDSRKQLVYCDGYINNSKPIFIDIGNNEPIALFGGMLYMAAISSEGQIIFINRNLLKKSLYWHIEPISLPDNEKASSVACCDHSVVALSTSGRVFTSSIEEGSSTLKFSSVVELADKEIVWVSGTREHFLAVSKDGCVFARGSNGSGEIGFDKETKSVSTFTEISSLKRYKIRAAYAGCYHSLFETQEGKVLSCGANSFGQLFLSSSQGDVVYSPSETTIRGGATFCIAGDGLSVVFIGMDPPANTPNRPVKQQQ